MNVIAICGCPHIATHQRTLGECGFPTPVLGSHLPSSFCLLQKVLPENLVSPYIHFSLHIVCSIQRFLMLRQGKVDPERGINVGEKEQKVGSPHIDIYAKGMA